MRGISPTAAALGLICCFCMLLGCAEVVVPGAMTGAGEYYRYTTSNVGKKTLVGDIDRITTATRTALNKMDIRLQLRLKIGVNPEFRPELRWRSRRHAETGFFMQPVCCIGGLHPKVDFFQTGGSLGAAVCTYTMTGLGVYIDVKAES